jgi:hypothetical protein
VIENTHLNDYNEDYGYDDSNIHITGKKQRLKTGGLANSRGTNQQSVIPFLDGMKAVSCNKPYCQNSC